MAETPSLAGHEEEKLDIFVFRPLAHPFAVVAAKLGMTPNAVSVLGMLTGIAGGWFFQYQAAMRVLPGVVLFCLRNVLDYADGQLARMTGTGTKYGYYFDGLCDYAAYVSVYVFAAVGIWPEYGAWSLALMVGAGVSAGLHSPLLDFYKHEYMYWAVGKDSAQYRLPDVVEQEREGLAPRSFDRFLLSLAVSYSARQKRWTKSRRALHDSWAPHRDDEAFRERYSRIQRWPLKLWFLVGPNWQAYLFFAAGLLGHMDWYLWAQIVWMNAVFGLALVAQREADRRVLATVG